MKVLKKILKGVPIVIVVLVVFYVGFVVIDCERLENSDFGTKPVITLSEDVKSVNSRTYVATYNGLGYSVTYTYSIYQTEINGRMETVEEYHGANCEWFGKIIWAWIS